MERGPLRILVVQHEADAGPGLVGERLVASGCAVTFAAPAGVLPNAVAIPADPAGFDGVVVLGGTPGPLDDERAPWLPACRALIASCVAGGVPLLGICLGAQMLATVAGGHVTPMPDGPEIGVFPLSLESDAFGDTLLGGLEDPIQAVQWHELEVSELPPGSRRLLAGARCSNQAFRLGRSAWGIQFHLEVLADSVAAWARAERDVLDRCGINGPDLVADVRAAEDGLRWLWEPVTDRWISVCVNLRDTEPSA